LLSRWLRRASSRPRTRRIKVEAAAEVLAKAILARRAYISFPWTLAWIARVMRLLPAPLYDRLIRALDRG
jgi:hypothetical protein